MRQPRMRRINVTVPGDLVARAKAAGLNISEATREALTDRLAELAADRDAASSALGSNSVRERLSEAAM